MNIHFHLPYRTVYGEQIGIEYYEEKYKRKKWGKNKKKKKKRK